MSSPIPPGWDDWVLSDWTDVHGPYGGDIIWNELTDKVSPNRLRLSAEQSSGAELMFLTTWDVLNDPDGAQSLAETILGGYSETDNTMYPPWAHPQYEELFATDIEISSFYPDNTGSTSSGGLFMYRYAVCKVSFQSLPYGVGTSDSSGGGAWMEWRTSASNDRFTVPVGVYEFTSGTYNGQDAQFGQVTTAGTSYQELIIHRIPDTYAISGGAGQSVFAVNCGKVNSDTSGTFSLTHQWLLDSVTMEPFGDWNGNNIYDIHLHFIFHPQGWYSSLDPGGAWSTIALRGSGNPPFAATNFADMINAVIPGAE